MYSDYNQLILNGLYQGSAPYGDPEMLAHDHNFDVVVLCASENPNVGQHVDIEVIEALGDDTDNWPMNQEHVEKWHEAARIIAQRVKDGARVLVTCVAGLNRSGFVCALVLHELYGWSGEKCVKYVQSKRPDALFRKSFKRHLEAFIREKE